MYLRYNSMKTQVFFRKAFLHLRKNCRVLKMWTLPVGEGPVSPFEGRTQGVCADLPLKLRKRKGFV